MTEMSDMNVLVACEESGIVRDAFIKQGHNAWSNDIQETAVEGPHIMGDAWLAIETMPWDLIIMHPPCCHMAVSGNRWYGRGTDGYHKRVEACQWTVKLWNKACEHSARVVMENPVSVLWQHMRGIPIQYVQPYWFGHKETKKTGFALRGVTPLVPTDMLELPEKGSKEHLEWQKVWRMAPSADRKKMRSRTYTGIANAMADQWSIT
jgi:hypothetical protein